ncbi:general stress protein CsbD, partial [Methylobacterium tarhaniae]
IGVLRAANQVAGGAQYAYGRARDRAEDVIDDGRHIAHTARERAEDLAHTARGYAEDITHTARERADHVIRDGRHVAREARRRGESYGRQALAYADGHRTNTVLGIAALAFAAGWLLRRKR